MYEDFSIEEKICVAAIFTNLFKNIISHQFVQPLIMLKNPKLEDLKYFCANMVGMTLLDESIRQDCTISKFIWINMDTKNKKLILTKLIEVEKIVKGDPILGLLVMQSINGVLQELEVRPYSHDENGFHFKQYGIL